METYLVGGAIRDTLIGKPVHERDYVVVGATPAEMLAQGFRQVGKDFPVFLHPQTGEEYALARTERKQGRGYTGFTINAEPTVTLEQDLLRRDLTINAMAQTKEGQLIDPYGGQQDLAKRLLRHVSEAFVEDPLRILRVARFAARFHEDGFTVAPETLQLMQQIVGELDTISCERVWVELSKALVTPHPEIFFAVLHKAKALDYWFPEFTAKTVLKTLSTRFSQRKEADIKDLQVSYSILVSTLTATQIEALNQRLKVPNETAKLASLTAATGAFWRTSLSPAQLYALFQQADCWRRPERFTTLITIWQCLGLATSQATRLQAGFHQAQQVSAERVMRASKQPLVGAEIGAAIATERTNILAGVLPL